MTVTPTVVTATNHGNGNPAILDSTTPTALCVGLAQAWPGHERQVFGQPLLGQGELKTLPGGQIVRDYAGLAAKTLPSTWLEEGQTLGTEAIVREGYDFNQSHTVRMEWRQR